MKFLKFVLPNDTTALNLALLVLVYLDMRNPMMGFLMGTTFWVFACICAVCSIISAITLFAFSRNNKIDHISK